MARDKERATAPPQYDTPPPPQLPGADYSYTVELVGGIQRELGKLTAEVTALKDQSKAHGEKLGQVSTDIHTAKTTLKVVGTILAATLAFAGWAINKGVDAYVSSHQAAPSPAAISPPAKP